MDETTHSLKRQAAGRRTGNHARSHASRLALAVTTLSLVASGLTTSQAASARGHSRLEVVPAPQVVTQEPANSAETACLVDVATGRVLYEKHGDRRMRIASLTKIVTAWIAVRSGKLDQVVTASPNATRQEGSSIYLAKGERQTLRALTYALMMRSGNDAAMAIAEFLDGSEAKFAEHMNREVRSLGLTHTHFMNPHGLDHDEHFSTAHDMGVITATALRVPEFHRIVSTKFYTIPMPGETWDRKLRNKNKLLWMMPGADGVKTGYTKKAGRCLASSATRDGHQVALVLLRDGNDWIDSIHLLTYGLTGFNRTNIGQLARPAFTTNVRYGVVDRVRLQPTGTLVYPVRPDEVAEIVTTAHTRPLGAPVRKGQVAGSVDYQLHGVKVGTLPLVAAEAVEPKGLWGRIRGLFAR